MQDLVILCRAPCAALSTTPQLPNPGISWSARCTDERVSESDSCVHRQEEEEDDDDDEEDEEACKK
jgi:hypothetical protein